MPRKRNQIVRPIIKRQDRMDYIIAGACNFFKIKPSDLRKYCYTKKTVPKKLTIKLLHDIGDIPIRDIASFIGLSQVATYSHYTTVTQDLNDCYYGNTELKRTYKELLERLDL